MVFGLNSCSLMKQSKIAKIIDLSLLTFIILWSGGCVTYGIWNNWPLHLLPFLIVLIVIRHLKLKASSFVPMAIIGLLVFIQMLVYNGAPISAIRIALIVFDITLAAIILKDTFVENYVDIMLFFAATALGLYLFDVFGGHSILLSIAEHFPQGGREIMAEFDQSREISKTLWIYQVQTEFTRDYIRNSGPFWEPGRFTIYLNIAIFFCLYHFKYRINSKQVILLILCNLTTVSTTGYITMFLILGFYIFNGNSRRTTKTVLALFMIIALYFVLQADFMTEKISGEMSSNEAYSRFGAIAYHYSQIKESPLLGFGPYLKDVFGFDLAVSPNGLTDSIRFFGLPCALYLWYLIYKGSFTYLRADSKRVNIVFLLSVLILAFTQTIMNSPFLYLLYAMGAMNDNARNYAKV